MSRIAIFKTCALSMGAAMFVFVSLHGNKIIYALIFYDNLGISLNIMEKYLRV